MSSLQRSPGEKLRIDRWLFFTRFYKTRSLASEAVAGGHVRLNGVRVSPGQRVAVGDVTELVRNRMPYKLVVKSGLLSVQRLLTI